MALSNGNNKNENGKPYVFQDDDFTTLFENQEGSLRALKKFSEGCSVLKGIEKYRVLILEANPLTFLTPSHWDSDIVFFVGQGKATISLVFEKNRESYNIEKGHLMTVPAGVTFYIINSDDNDKLILSMFVISLANSGHFVPFFTTGIRDPKSFMSAFSSEVLESSYNTSKDELHKFSQRSEGVIRKASKEQILALTADEGKEVDTKFMPSQIYSHLRETDECGKLFMVDFRQYQKLQELDMFVSFSNLTPGCMNCPFISSRATKIIMVVKGQGHVEIVAASNGEEGSNPIEYKKFSSELKPGVVFVVLPGHPMALKASQDEILETICFEVNAKGNQKFSIAGKVNLMKNIQKEAKVLTFGTSSEEVDNLLDSQQNELFLRWSN